MPRGRTRSGRPARCRPAPSHVVRQLRPPPPGRATASKPPPGNSGWSVTCPLTWSCRWSPRCGGFGRGRLVLRGRPAPTEIGVDAPAARCHASKMTDMKADASTTRMAGSALLLSRSRRAPARSRRQGLSPWTGAPPRAAERGGGAPGARMAAGPRGRTRLPRCTGTRIPAASCGRRVAGRRATAAAARDRPARTAPGGTLGAHQGHGTGRPEHEGRCLGVCREVQLGHGPPAQPKGTEVPAHAVEPGGGGPGRTVPRAPLPPGWSAVRGPGPETAGQGCRGFQQEAGCRRESLPRRALSARQAPRGVPRGPAAQRGLQGRLRKTAISKDGRDAVQVHAASAQQVEDGQAVIDLAARQPEGVVAVDDDMARSPRSSTARTWQKPVSPSSGNVKSA